MMHEFCGTGEDEDPVSIGLTALSRLMYRYNVKFEEVGMMYVGSESLIDRAKSIKSNLMMLFNEHNCHDVEGVDTYNACYGGTAALLNCVNWSSSDSWDGRLAIAVATDIADSPAGYRFMTGCACVASASASQPVSRSRDVSLLRLASLPPFVPSVASPPLTQKASPPHPTPLTPYPSPLAPFASVRSARGCGRRPSLRAGAMLAHHQPVGLLQAVGVEGHGTDSGRPRLHRRLLRVPGRLPARADGEARHLPRDRGLGLLRLPPVRDEPLGPPGP